MAEPHAARALLTVQWAADDPRESGTSAIYVRQRPDDDPMVEALTDVIVRSGHPRLIEVLAKLVRDVGTNAVASEPTPRLDELADRFVRAAVELADEWEAFDAANKL